MAFDMNVKSNEWESIAFNTAPDSENQIHGDELAIEYGFEGGLVPGVTISAYLVHPIVEKWGKDWLENGFANCRINSPLYDKELFIVKSEFLQNAKANTTLVRNNGIVSANAEVSIVKDKVIPPILRGDTLADSDYNPPRAQKRHWQNLKSQGCLAFRFRWGGKEPLIYSRDADNLPSLLQPNKGGYANLAFLLGCSNWALAGNAYMNPWVHLQTISQNYKAVQIETDLIAEMEIINIFEKKGHEFVNVQVNLFDEEDEKCVMSINLIAIYKLRGQL